MIKKLVKIGHSHAIVIDKPVLSMLGWDKSTELSFTTDGVNLLVCKKPEAVSQEADLAKNICRQKRTA